MQNPNSVITHAFRGLVEEVAADLGISDKRLYLIFSQHDPYAKLWRYITALGHINADRLELIRADFNARCDRITRGRSTPSTAASLNKELDEAVQQVLEKRPRAERKQAILEAMTELQKQLETCDDNVVNIGSLAS